MAETTIRDNRDSAEMMRAPGTLAEMRLELAARKRISNALNGNTKAARDYRKATAALEMRITGIERR